MEESSDPLLLTKTAHKLIKGTDGVPGTLLITQTKVKWLPDDRSSLKPIIIELSSIIKQQQAPGKPFLRILSSGEPLGLSFSSETDKNEVLEYLKQLKPAGNGLAQKATEPRAAGVPTEAEKRQIFAIDKDLEILYGQLVTSGVLSESDFWRVRQQTLQKLLEGPRSMGPQQRSGLPSVMHEVERLHDGSTERVSIRLSPQDIQRIFVERPEVHRAFMAHVPHAMEEKEFWQRYFKLEYKKAARRKRLAGAGRVNVSEEDLEDTDDLFAPFRRQLAESEASAAKAKIPSVDPSVNLVAEFGDRWTGGFGPLTHTGSEEGVTPSFQKELRPVDTIAHELNRHAAQVLAGAPEGLPGDLPDDSDTASIAAQVAAAITKRPIVKEHSMQDPSSAAYGGNLASGLEDLTLDESPQGVPLNIRDPRSYFGATSESKAEGAAIEPMAVQPTTAPLDVLADIDPFALSDPPCQPSAALNALLDIVRDEDEALIAEFGPVAATVMGTHPKNAMGSVMIEFFRMEALKTNELLRHLWGCFPLISHIRRQKSSSLVRHLEEQRKSLVAHTATNQGTAQQVYISQMIRPLIEAIDAGLDMQHDEEKSLIKE